MLLIMVTILFASKQNCSLNGNGTTYQDKAEMIVQSNGSELTNTKAVKGNAKRKMITQKMVLGLVDVYPLIPSILVLCKYRL